jgi:hypothetical protein
LHRHYTLADIERAFPNNSLPIQILAPRLGTLAYRRAVEGSIKSGEISLHSSFIPHSTPFDFIEASFH